MKTVAGAASGVRPSPINGPRSLASAPAAGGHAVSAGRAFARRVELLLAVRIEMAVGHRHHWIGQTASPVLRNHGAADEKRANGKEHRHVQSVPPIWIPTSSGEIDGETATSIRCARSRNVVMS